MLALLCLLSNFGTGAAYYSTGLHGLSFESTPNARNMETSSSTLESEFDGRLPRHLEPMIYKLEMFPYIYGTNSSRFRFSGNVWIKFKCIESSTTITLNINKLDILNSSLNVKSILVDKVVEIVRYEVDTQLQFLTIYLDEFLQPDVEYFVSMSFTGNLKTDYAGMYLSIFPNRTTKQYVVATQFSPTEARKAFPCFDEPDRKAQFDITIIRHQDMISLSNMPIQSSKKLHLNFVADIYERTPKMSTYLVAMAVGDLVSITRSARNGLNYTTWAGKESINKTEHALKLGAEISTYFEKYFDTLFPLPKQDILAVPQTAVSAMENWGLIIFNQDIMLYEPGVNSLSNLMLLSMAVSHEVVHQWFGNLVTMSWWSDLFIKEGFAVYLAEVGLSKIYPEWNVLNHFAVKKMHDVFDDDGLVSSHPVHKKLADATEIRQVFDSISYTKGGCMIRMLNFILGDADFEIGVRKFLRKFKYSSVTRAGLWKTIEPTPLTYYHPPGVSQVMETWILQKNYPVITVRQEKPGVLKITQQRFLNDPSEAVNDKDISPFNYIWKVPLTYTSNVNSVFRVTYKDIIWLEDKVVFIVDRQLVDLTLPGNWIIVNLQQWGYYRVNYENNIWRNLIQQLNDDKTKIDPVNRAQIINDLFSLSKAKMVELKLALSVFEYLRFEDEFVPWLAALKEIRNIIKLIQNMKSYDKFKEVLRFLIKTIYSNLEWNKNTLTMEQHLLRDEIFSLANTIEMHSCKKQSENAFTLWKNKNVPLDENIRSTVVCAGIQEGNESDWNYVFHRYNTALNANEKNDYLKALTCTKTKLLQHRLFNLTKDQSVFHRREISSTFTSLLQNPTALEEVWQNLKSRWQQLLDIFAGTLFLLSNVVREITKSFTTTAQLRDLEQFIATTANLGPSEQAFKQGVEYTKANIRWLKENKATVEVWIAEMSGKYRLVG